MSKSFSDSWQAERAAKKIELTAKLSEGFEVDIEGKQLVRSEWNSEKHGSDYFLRDVYDLSLDLSGNDGKRIGGVTVKLPGVEVELGNGWFRVETDYKWTTYVEYDAPKTWKRSVLKEGGE